ncbi:hypothetical protein QYF36_024965 [Acer negundo]|nr:hypothetical protein QYF36_024965 [Acer negundo]
MEEVISGSDDIIPNTVMEGVGKGKENMERSMEQVKEKVLGDSKGIVGRRDGFVSGDYRPGPRWSKELCVVVHQKSICLYGLLLLEKASGPVLSENPIETPSSKSSHKTSRWKRFDHKQRDVFTSNERVVKLGKRSSSNHDTDRQTSKKKSKETQQRSSGGEGSDAERSPEDNGGASDYEIVVQASGQMEFVMGKDWGVGCMQMSSAQVSDETEISTSQFSSTCRKQ